jgi:penicillin amidase
MFFSKFPILSRTLVFVISPLLIVAVYFVLTFTKSIPEQSAYLLDASGNYMAQISRDNNGVTYIDGTNDSNAYYALGYAHASDRMWQLEVQRRIGSGRLSEIFGKESLGEDIWLRTIGLHKSAEDALANNSLSSDELRSLYAYTAGINAWIAEGNELPPEFHFFGFEPESWSITDSLAWMKAFQMLLAGNMWEEIRKSTAKGSLTKEMYDSIYGLSADSNHEVNVTKENNRTSNDFLQIEKSLVSKLGLGGKYIGSNSWVVSGEYTESGRPTLVNDPHLKLQNPSLFYNARIVGDNLAVQGMTLVGLPVVIFGKNKDIAWGGTSLMADVQDIFVEQINPKNPNQYLYKGEWKNMIVRDEYIKIAKKKPSFLNEEEPPFHLSIRTTNKGPLISDAVGYTSLGGLSLSWIALDKNDETYSSFYKLNYAKNWSDFTRAFENFVAPALNMFYVDKENIGKITVGHIPIRTNNEGKTMQAGWDDYSWKGVIPYNEMFKSFNPKEGFLANANNEFDVTKNGEYISSGFAESDRYDRISQLLSSKIDSGKKVSVDYLTKMLKDTQSYEAEIVGTLTRGIVCKGSVSCSALAALKGWDGNFRKESVGGAIYYFYLDHLKSEVLSVIKKQGTNAGPDDALEMIINSVSYKDMVRIIGKESAIWCSDLCYSKEQSAWDKTIIRLTKLKGSDIKSWTWGSLNTTVYGHTPFSNLSWVKPIYELKAQGEGSTNTINVAGTTSSKEDGYHQTRGASFRQIMSIDDDGGEHLFVLAPGQSSHPLSKFYSNFLQKFSDNIMTPYCEDGSCNSTLIKASK